MPHRALITGVTGFAGGYLAEYLLEGGDQVLGCSPDGSWDRSSPPELPNRVELVTWDLAKSEGLPEAARRRIESFRPDGIYHLAALSIPDDCGEEDPTSAALAVNVDGTRRVLHLAASLASRPRVLFPRSSHVYKPVSAESPRVRETSPLGPTRGYGRTKLLAEAEVCRAVEKSDVDAVIARSFQHAGPRQDQRMMLSQWARQIAAGGPAPVRVHTCDAHLDLTDVRDVVRAYRLLIEHGRRGGTYNVGSGVNRRSGDVLELLRRATDSQRPIVELHPGAKQDPIADTTRLVRCTGWQPEIPIEQTAADTLAWWQQVIASSSRE
jgi:GDP-4-dehydro-6-deoxy-D-mannose reductase